MNSKQNTVIFIAMISLLIITIAIGISNDNKNSRAFFERSHVTQDQTTKLSSEQIIRGVTIQNGLSEYEILENEAAHLASITPILTRVELQRYLKKSRVNFDEITESNSRNTLPDCAIYSTEEADIVLSSISTNGIDIQLHKEACRIYKNRFNEKVIANIAKNADVIRQNTPNITL
ncbi:hypothetical protein LMH73_021875 [Vibrio splendidus]|nr:hypothetical protein [Vibrio splendidus]MCC4880494.1 hypothetical protein [Vibrio splendidus]